jgi:hypothetical protein
MQTSLQSIHLDRLLAISLVGVASLVLIAVNQTSDAMFLLGAMAVWAFKNGVSNAPNQQTPTEKDTASTVPLTSLSTNSDDNDFSTNLLSLADEAYEELPQR